MQSIFEKRKLTIEERQLASACCPACTDSRNTTIDPECYTHGSRTRTVVNLKLMLMQLGNELVPKGFSPNDPHAEKSTAPIVAFTEWLNNTPEAQALLLEMDVEWRMPTG